MDPRESSPLKEALKRNGSSVRFASLFGSCSRGDADHISDMDVFIVCEDEADKPGIVSSLTKLSSEVGREVHINIFTPKGFEERIRNHDYLITSILDDSSFIFGDEEAFSEEKRRIFERPIDIESVRFNRRMGLKMLDRADDRLRKLLSNISYIHNLELKNVRDNVLLGCLRDCHLGLGYFAASEKMMQLNRAVPFRQLLRLDEYSLIKDLIQTEKIIIRKGTVKPADVTNLFNCSKRLVNTSEFSLRMKIF